MQFNRRLVLVAAIGLGLLSVVAVFAMRARTQPAKTFEPGPAQPRFEVERITVREWGFEPAQIERRAGPFLLTVQNQSGLAEIELSLIDETHNQRTRLPDTRNALTFKQRMELPPGTYLIKESGHPDWQCRITIGQ